MVGMIMTSEAHTNSSVSPVCSLIVEKLRALITCHLRASHSLPGSHDLTSHAYLRFLKDLSACHLQTKTLLSLML